jgi:hypothetical protein
MKISDLLIVAAAGAAVWYVVTRMGQTSTGAAALGWHGTQQQQQQTMRAWDQQQTKPWEPLSGLPDLLAGVAGAFGGGKAWQPLTDLPDLLAAPVADYRATGNHGYSAPPAGYTWNEPIGGYVSRDEDGAILGIAI